MRSQAQIVQILPAAFFGWQDTILWISTLMLRRVKLVEAMGVWISTTEITQDWPRASSFCSQRMSLHAPRFLWQTFS
jgi:hypothetical protein